MYICICNAITERSVRQAAAEGAHTLSELTQRTGCAGACGGCAELAEQVLREECTQRSFALSMASAA